MSGTITIPTTIYRKMMSLLEELSSLGEGNDVQKPTKKGRPLPIDEQQAIRVLISRFPDTPEAELTRLVHRASADLAAGRNTPTVETLALMLNQEAYDTILQGTKEVQQGKLIAVERILDD